MSTTVATDGVQLLKLFVSSVTPDNPTIAVRWCVDPMLVKELVDRKVVNPYLLLVVWSAKRQGRQCEERWLVPLNQAMKYIQLASPGMHLVFGTVVWNRSGDSRRLFNEYLARRSGRYNDTVVNDYDHSLTTAFAQFGFGPIEVNVNREHFAPEPAEWEKRWVNLWYEGKMPENQCHFRRRRLVAYSIQPAAMLVFWLGRVVVGLFFLAIYLFVTADRWPHWRRIFQPWKYNPLDICDDGAKPSVLYNRKQWMFTPAAWLGAWLLAKLFLFLFFRGHASWLQVAITAVATLVWASFMVYIGLGAFERAIEKAQQETRAPKPAREARVLDQRQRLLTAYQQEFMPLLCQPGVRAALDDLPPEKRSLTLRFNSLKTKVCRPFAE